MMVKKAVVDKTKHGPPEDWLINLEWAHHLNGLLPMGYYMDSPHSSPCWFESELWDDLRSLGYRRLGKKALKEALDARKEQFGPAIANREYIDPLSTGWPKNSGDLAYIMSLIRLGREYGYVGGYNFWAVRWKEELLRALDLRDTLEWPTRFREHGGARNPWFLSDPYGQGGRIPGEWAVIRELAIRNKLADCGLSVYYTDIAEILAERPWAGCEGHAKRATEYLEPNWSPILLEGSGQKTSTNLRRSCDWLQGFASRLSQVSTGDDHIDLREELRGLVHFFHSVKTAATVLCPTEILGEMSEAELTADELYEPIHLPVVEKSPLAHTWVAAAECLAVAEWTMAHHLNVELPLACGETFKDVLDSDMDRSYRVLESLADDDIRRLFPNHKEPRDSYDPHQQWDRFANGGMGAWCGSCQIWSRPGFTCSPYSKNYGWEE